MIVQQPTRHVTVVPDEHTITHILSEIARQCIHVLFQKGTSQQRNYGVHNKKSPLGSVPCNLQPVCGHTQKEDKSTLHTNVCDQASLAMDTLMLGKMQFSKVL